MLPTGHIEFTWAALNVVQRRTGWFRDTDYRLMAVAALAPDLLDKPLALTFYRDTDAALFWGHNLWLHMAVWLVAWALIVGQTRSHKEAGAIRRRFAGILPYLLAFSGHLLADRMWGFRESLFYPLGAGYWHPWVHVGEPAAMLAAYLHIIRTTPILVAFEVDRGGAAGLVRGRSPAVGAGPAGALPAHRAPRRRASDQRRRHLPYTCPCRRISSRRCSVATCRTYAIQIRCQFADHRTHARVQVFADSPRSFVCA